MAHDARDNNILPITVKKLFIVWGVYILVSLFPTYSVLYNSEPQFWDVCRNFKSLISEWDLYTFISL